MRARLIDRAPCLVLPASRCHSSMDFKANTAADINIDISTDKSWNENIGIAEEKLHEVSRIKGEKSKKQ